MTVAFKKLQTPDQMINRIQDNIAEAVKALNSGTVGDTTVTLSRTQEPWVAYSATASGSAGGVITQGVNSKYRYSRSGTLCTVQICLHNSTKTAVSDPLISVSLPFPNASPLTEVSGGAQTYDNTTVNNVGTINIAPNGTTASFFRGANAAWTGTSGVYAIATFQYEISEANAYYPSTVVVQAEGEATAVTTIEVPWVEPWQPFTPVINGVVSTNIAGRYRRDGDTAEIMISVTTISSFPSNLGFGIPTGLTIDTAKLPNGNSLVGGVRGRDGLAGNPVHDGFIHVENTTRLFAIRVNGGNEAVWGPTVPVTWTVAPALQFEVVARVPIVGWAATRQLTVRVQEGSAFPATTTMGGVVSTSEQSYAGLKRFTGGARITGRTDGVAPATMEIGEVREVIVDRNSNVALTTGVARTVATMTLQPGEYDICAVGGYISTTTSATQLYVSLLTGVGLNDQYGTVAQIGRERIGNSGPLNLSVGDTNIAVPTFSVRLTTATPVYLNLALLFSVGTAGGYGRIYARRTA